jgi:hypothetical protein
VTVSNGKINIASGTGNIVITAVAEEIKASYTNLADPTSSDWWVDSRVGSDNARRNDKPGYAVTNYIGPVNAGDVIEITGMDFKTSPGGSCVYKSDKTVYTSVGVGNMAAYNDGTIFATDAVISTTGLKITMVTDNIKYWRFCGKLTGTANDVIITINEPIA